MLLQDIKEIKTGKGDLRKFGLVVGGVFSILGLVMMARGKGHFMYFLAPGVVLVGLGLLLPRALKYVQLTWMTLAIFLGFVVSHVLLTLFFFLVIAPIGLTARVVGKDFLRLKLQRDAPTYWLPKENRAKSAADYEKQF